MHASCYDPLSVEALDAVPPGLFFLEASNGNVDSLCSIRYHMPPLLDNLTPLLVAHERELSLDLRRRLALIDAVRADPLGLGT